MFRRTSLVSHNTVLTLGHMAVALKNVQHTQQSILARFQQRIGDPPSPLDILIINQIGCMLITSLVSSSFAFRKTYSYNTCVIATSNLRGNHSTFHRNYY